MARALLFDLDGTLSDPREGIIRSIEHALEHMGVPAPGETELEQWIGPPLEDSFAELFDGDRTLATAALRVFRDRYGTIGLFENRLYAGVRDTLVALRERDCRLFIATSKPETFAIRIVEHFELAPLFEAVFGSELDGRRADKTELLAHVLSTTALDARASVMIGDRKHDIIAARAHGMRSIGVAWGFGSIEELRESGADVICASFEDLLPLVCSETVAERRVAAC